VKTAEGGFGEQSTSEDDGDDADLGSDGDFEDWDSSSLASKSTEGAVPIKLAGLKHAMSIRLDFLEIGESLENRLQLLRFFVSDSVGLVPPTAVDVVRWRKCGVLRWLVAESFVHLEAMAVSDMQISYRLNYVTFLAKSTIPSSMKDWGHSSTFQISSNHLLMACSLIIIASLT
jgi:hypothetical protein